MDVVVREADEADAGWIRHLLETRWGGSDIVVRGEVHDAGRLPALVADRGGRCGLITYRVVGEACLIVSLDAVEKGRGIGTRLVETLVDRARAAGCGRISVATTNDNLDALRFYQRRGFVIAAVHVGAIAAARRIKPAIPLVGEHGIPIRDEVEFTRLL
jgi:GNAT superfamily N-acetyltransferase